MISSLRRKTTATIAAFAIASLGVLPATAAAQGNRATALAVPILGTVTAPFTGTFNGSATLTSFSVVNGVLMAVGTLTGTVTNTATGAVTSIAANFSAPVTTAQASCQILNLVLGPLHLDLLGLMVDLNQVVLTITAVPGAGNLLGNLLCSIAGLLDNPSGGTGGLARLLNQVLGILNGL